jgi:hypothetical protein
MFLFVKLNDKIDFRQNAAFFEPAIKFDVNVDIVSQCRLSESMSTKSANL